MATRGHYIFNKKTIVYNHWDNYPEGASILLQKMLLQESEHCADWAGRFLRANPTAELTNGEFYGGAEYNYYIDTEKKQIRVMSVYWDDESEQDREQVFFEGSIFDFINEYFPKSAEVGRLPEYKQSTFIKLNTWKNGECIASLKKELLTQAERFAEYCTFEGSNPNKSDKYIQETLEKMKKFFD